MKIKTPIVWAAIIGMFIVPELNPSVFKVNVAREPEIHVMDNGENSREFMNGHITMVAAVSGTATMGTTVNIGGYQIRMPQIG